MSSATLRVCEILPWDSDFFKIRIGRLTGDRLSWEIAAGADQWADRNGVQCVYFLARVDDPTSIQIARDYCYDLVDIRLTLARSELREDPGLTTSRSDVLIRAAEPKDLTTLQAMARLGHGDTRFFTDSHFPRQRAEELYSTWITLESQGRAAQVLVAVSPEGLPQGYISCHLDRVKRLGQIGLVGVGGEVRGKGIGKALVLAALDWFGSNGALEATVVTQGRNFLAQRLYQRCGFMTQNVQLRYHKWFTRPQPRPSSST
jgi:ribosomal protein S18 acetylase RimI-like enzyme